GARPGAAAAGPLRRRDRDRAARSAGAGRDPAPLPGSDRRPRREAGRRPDRGRHRRRPARDRAPGGARTGYRTRPGRAAGRRAFGTLEARGAPRPVPLATFTSPTTVVDFSASSTATVVGKAELSGGVGTMDGWPRRSHFAQH